MSKPVVFHSENIKDTKAHEKREVFVKVEEKKTLKQSAEEFQKKFAEAKAHAAESRARIENPGVDENSVVSSRTKKPFPTKLVLKIGIPVLILAGVGLAIYLNWGAIHHEFFEVSEARAYELLPKDPVRAASMFKKVLSEKTEPKAKGQKGVWYANQILNTCRDESGFNCSAELVKEVIKIAIIAEESSPTYLSADILETCYTAIGDEPEAKNWHNNAENRYEEGEDNLGEG